MLEINNQNYKEEGKLEKILLSVSIGVFLSVLFLVKPFSIPLAGLIIFLLIIAWKVKIENFIKIFILLYPIMPFHAGVDLGFMLPVVKLHRVFILLLILCWLKNKKGIKLKSFLQFPLTRVLGIMLGVYFIAFMVRFNLKGFIFSSSTLVLENFMIIYIFYDVFKNKRIEEIKTIYKYLMISAIILLFLGIVEWITHFNVFSFISPYREVLEGAVRMQGRFGIGRVKAAFPHPLDYGVFFAMVAPAGLLFLKSKEIDTKKKNYSLMYVCFFAICFLGCYSR